MTTLPYRGLLLTEYFLTRGILDNQRAWGGLKYARVDEFGGKARDILAKVEEGIKNRAERRKKAERGALFLDGDGGDSSLFSESETEHYIIFPLLRALGWEDAYAPQKPLGRDLPDVLLFPGARPGGWSAGQAKREAVAVQENKRWKLSLDSREGREQAPSTQMLRYLTNAASLPGGKIRWGILTNGRLWRLYSQDAGSRSEEFLELDLWEIIRVENERERAHWLRVFLLVFRREAFIPAAGLDGRTFHQYAVNEGRLWERQITVKLSRVLLEGDEGALPVLARGLVRVMPGDPADPKFLAELREVSATVLFRLLFVLYAEDRGLLPVDEDIVPVSLRDIRERIAEKVDDPRKLSFASGLHAYYDAFVSVCQLIDRGDEALKLPPYNGGLFAGDGPLAGLKIPDNVFAPVVDSLSRWRLRGEAEKTWVNFRDLSVQYLGAVYEQLLEREFGFHPASGEIQVRLSPHARKTGGSYYTPESLVRLVIERAVGPLVEEKIRAFQSAAKRKPSPEALRKLDPAEAVLNLKICDPAMGSGHFLVSLVDYVADRALEAVALAEHQREVPEYRSPLADQLHEMRERIRSASKRHLESEQLRDRLLMRRIVLKRVVYGADKNPLAAELAKLSLWLHTFTISAPLPFLDHHLRDGDSLFGQDLAPALKRAEDGGGKRLAEKIRGAARESAAWMAKVESRADTDIQQAKESDADFKRFAEKSRATARFLSLVHAEKWIGAGEKVDGVPAAERRENQKARGRALDEFFSGALGDPEAILAEWKPPDRPQKCADAMRDILARAAELHSREKFLHWDTAFSGVWPPRNGEIPEGGFDAVVGNPPWDQMKMEEVEWFRERRLDIAAQPANRRGSMIKKLREENDPLAAEYDAVARETAIAWQAAHECGDYSLLSGRDTNLYSLFVERALKLVRPDGMVGLLVPSGIYADKTTSGFFNKMSESGRIAAIFDFENRTGVPQKRARNGEEENGDDGSRFFPSVHPLFKFCAFIAGNKQGQFPKMESAFFLHSTDDIDNGGDNGGKRVDIPPEICALVNPNTKTAPVFRSPRDAEIITDIYRRVPVMHNHEKGAAWSVRQHTIFHMTGDSKHFHPDSKWKKDGYYRVPGSIYRRGKNRALPLYRGSMALHFNSRAASVVKSPKGVANLFRSEESSLEQLQKAAFLPSPMFWVEDSIVSQRLRNFPEGMEWMVGFRSIARTTDHRTLIAAVVPRAAVGNQLPLLMPAVPPRPDDGKEKELEEWRRQCELALAKYRAEAPLYLANLCSFALDYVCRGKVQATNVNWYMMEQLPVIPVSAYGRKFGEKTAGEIVREDVLRLTYAAEDMRPFARDMGCDGDPFGWDEERREKLRARLDALYFILYGIGEEDAEHIMSAFPIVEKKDRARHGHYRTRDLILEHMRALRAGDPDADIALPAPPPPKPPPKPSRKPARKRK